MLDLALKVLPGGLASAFDVLNATTDRKVVPFACEFVGVVVDISATPTNAHTADVLVNGAEIAVAVDVLFPATTQKGFFKPDARVFLAAGDVLSLRSNGENAAPDAYDVTLSYIFEPQETRPVGEVWLDGQAFTDLATPSNTSPTKCVPFACEVIAVAFGMTTATDAEVDVSVFLDNADSTIDIVIPTATSNAVLRPVGQVISKTAGSMHLTSDGAGTGGGATAVTYVLAPMSNEIPVGWVFVPFDGGLDFHTAGLEYVDIVSPVHGRVRDLVTHWTAPINTTPNTGQTFDLEVNAAKPTGTPIYRNEEDTLDEVGLSSPIENLHDVFVRQGDLITVESNGEQVAVTTNNISGVWIEPIGQSAFGTI